MASITNNTALFSSSSTTRDASFLFSNSKHLSSSLHFRSSTHFSKKMSVHASIDGVDSVSSTSLKSELDADYVPMPIVHIDQDSDSDATMVQVSFGDRLGALIDTATSNLKKGDIFK